MIRPNPRDDRPVVSETAFVDPTAILCGLIVVEDEVFIGPYAVTRADENGEIQPVRTGRGSIIRDGVVVHSKAGAAVTIGSRTSVAHRSLVHRTCAVGDEVLSASISYCLTACVVGRRSVIRHDSVIEGSALPVGFHALSTTTVHSDFDLAAIPHITPDRTAFSKSAVAANPGLAHAYRRITNQI